MREHGYRVTLQRQLILDAVCEGRGHTTFKEIYERARAKAPTINRTTVYRTLNFLCELRLVVAADIGNGRRVYEIAGDTPHHHLVCRRCGRVEQISHDVVRALLAAIERKSRFKVDMDHLVLLGLCPKCRHAEYGNET
ncbi:MAG: transcriptional repressor [Chloroflexi bacterium]|nr:transcriptional repressor [Chloroflexota bacterium]